MRIKICGTTSIEDARLAVDAGADLLGFIFYPRSPRCVTPDRVAEIVRELPAAIETVGVFVNATAGAMLETARAAGLTTLQLHGHEAPEILPELQAYRIIKAVALRAAADLSQLERYPGVSFLIDTPAAGWGGSGRTGDWDLAREAAQRAPILLAGGLTPENVAAAIAAVGPAGVDVASGVEIRKGVKDPAKVRRFTAAVRAAGGAP